jgi:hypothetical protein
MSTVILGQLARPEGIVQISDDPKKPWVEALAALVPGEALAAYTAMISFFTKKGEGTEATLTHEGWVAALTVAIAVLGIPFLYGRNSGVIWQRRHALRWGAAIVAFAVWLWLLPLSLWDTFVDLDGAIRAGVGIVAALIVVAAVQYAFRIRPLP